MLELRPNCECCDKDLPPDSEEAMICTFECTFCKDCVATELKGLCPCVVVTLYLGLFDQMSCSTNTLRRQSVFLKTNYQYHQQHYPS